MKHLTILLILLTACTTSRETLLEKKVFYTHSVDKNYAKLGKCMQDSFAAPKTTSSVTYTYANGVMIPVYTSQTVGIEGYEDEAVREYYINDYTKAGFNNFKNWIIIIKSANKKNTRSDIEIRSKKTIFGGQRFSNEFMEEKINKCL